MEQHTTFKRRTNSFESISCPLSSSFNNDAPIYLPPQHLRQQQHHQPRRRQRYPRPFLGRSRHGSTIFFLLCILSLTICFLVSPTFALPTTKATTISANKHSNHTTANNHTATTTNNNNNVTQISVTNTSNLEPVDPSVAGNTSSLTPVTSDTSGSLILDVGQKYKIIWQNATLGVLYILLGLLQVFFGFRFMRLTLLVAGFVTWAMIAMILMVALRWDLVYTTFMLTTYYFWVWLISGLVGGILCFRYWDFGVILSGAFGGFTFSMAILAIINNSISTVARYILLGICVFFGAGIASYYERGFVIVATSIGGAYLFMYGIDEFTQIGFREMLTIFSIAGASLQYHPNKYVFLMLGFGTCLAALGIWFEWWHHETPLLMDREALFRIYGRPFGKKPELPAGKRLAKRVKRVPWRNYFLSCFWLRRRTVEDLFLEEDDFDEGFGAVIVGGAHVVSHTPMASTATTAAGGEDLEHGTVQGARPITSNEKYPTTPPPTIIRNGNQLGNLHHAGSSSVTVVGQPLPLLPSSTQEQQTQQVSPRPLSPIPAHDSPALASAELKQPLDHSTDPVTTTDPTVVLPPTTAVGSKSETTSAGAAGEHESQQQLQHQPPLTDSATEGLAIGTPLPPPSSSTSIGTTQPSPITQHGAQPSTSTSEEEISFQLTLPRTTATTGSSSRPKSIFIPSSAVPNLPPISGAGEEEEVHPIHQQQPQSSIPANIPLPLSSTVPPRTVSLQPQTSSPTVGLHPGLSPRYDDKQEVDESEGDDDDDDDDDGEEEGEQGTSTSLGTDPRVSRSRSQRLRNAMLGL